MCSECVVHCFCLQLIGSLKHCSVVGPFNFFLTSLPKNVVLLLDFCSMVSAADAVTT